MGRLLSGGEAPVGAVARGGNEDGVMFLLLLHVGQAVVAGQASGQAPVRARCLPPKPSAEVKASREAQASNAPRPMAAAVATTAAATAATSLTSASSAATPMTPPTRAPSLTAKTLAAATNDMNTHEVKTVTPTAVVSPTATEMTDGMAAKSTDASTNCATDMAARAAADEAAGAVA